MKKYSVITGETFHPDIPFPMKKDHMSGPVKKETGTRTQKSLVPVPIESGIREYL